MVQFNAMNCLVRPTERESQKVTFLDSLLVEINASVKATSGRLKCAQISGQSTFKIKHKD